jgi:hypothetical protein
MIPKFTCNSEIDYFHFSIFITTVSDHSFDELFGYSRKKKEKKKKEKNEDPLAQLPWSGL